MYILQISFKKSHILELFRKKKMSTLASSLLTNTQIVIIWNSPRKLRTLFNFKDKLQMRFRSKILYRYTCNRGIRFTSGKPNGISLLERMSIWACPYVQVRSLRIIQILTIIRLS